MQPAFSHHQALAKAGAEYEAFRQSQAQLPEAVDQHFEQAINEVKRLAKVKPPTPPGKRPKRKRNEGDE